MLKAPIQNDTIPNKRRLHTLWQKKVLLDDRLIKALVLLLGCLLGTIVIITKTVVITKVQDANLDTGWQIAIAATFQQGFILGRDTFFTYGPLSQLIDWSATLFTASHSAFDSYALMVVVHRCLAVLCLSAILMLIPQIRWRYALFVFLASVLLDIALENFYYRSYFLILAALFLARSLAAQNQRRQLIWAVCCGAWALALQMVTFELGLYAVFSTLAILVVLMILSWQQWFRSNEWLPVKNLALILGTTLGVYLAGNLLVSLLFKLTSANYTNLFDYQLLSLGLVRGYNYTFGSLWEFGTAETWVLVLVIIYTIGMVIWYCKKLPLQEAYLLFSLLIFSLFELKSTIIRSDLGHIIYAAIPILILFLLLGHNWLKTGRHIRLGWAGLLLALVICWPLASLDSYKTLGQVLDGNISVRAKVKQIFEQKTSTETLVPKGMLLAADPGKAVLTFPYEYYYGLGFNKKIIAPFLQSYAAQTLSLQQYFVDSMAHDKDKLEIVYGLDGIVSSPIDNVQNITRVPRIFEYIYQNYELKTRDLYSYGYMLLKARPERHDMVSTPLSFTTEKTASNLYTYRLSQPTNCSMIRLTPKVDYPVTSLLGRPNNFLVDFWSKGKKFLETGMVTIEPGKPFGTYISLINPGNFWGYFTSKPVQIMPLDAIQIKYKETGLFGVDPSSLDLTKLECITFQR